jgi:hypothetical protein
MSVVPPASGQSTVAMSPRYNPKNLENLLKFNAAQKGSGGSAPKSETGVTEETEAAEEVVEVVIPTATPTVAQPAQVSPTVTTPSASPTTGLLLLALVIGGAVYMNKR